MAVFSEENTAGEVQGLLSLAALIRQLATQVQIRAQSNQVKSLWAKGDKEL